MAAEFRVELARKSLKQLVKHLELLVERDPEQEVQAIAIRPLDRALVEARTVLAGNPVAQSVADVISADAISGGEPLSAADALIVSGRLLAALPLPSPRRATFM